MSGKMKALLLVGFFCLLGLSVGNMPPALTCPSSFRTFVKEGKTSALVTWNPPTATDQEDITLEPKLHPLSPKRGSWLEKGPHVISYRVFDKGGRKDTCSFTVTVAGADCPAALSVSHGDSTCSQGAIFGQICYVSCDQGYEVFGNNAVTCNEDGQYSGPVPVCEELTFYTKICRNIAFSTAEKIIRDIDTNFHHLKMKLQAAGSLSTYRTFRRAKKLCKIPEHAGYGACVFLRRYNLFEALKTDLKKIAVISSGNQDNNWQQFTYRRLMLLHPEISKFCQQSTFLNEFFNSFPDIERFSNTDYQRKFRKSVESLIKSKTTTIRSEALKFCGPDHSGPECLLRDVLELVDRAELFISHLEKTGGWKDIDINHYFNALTFNSIILKLNYQGLVGAIQPQKVSVQQNVITQILRAIAMYIDDGDDDKLRTVVAMFPEVVTDKICSNGKMCLFWRVVDQTRVYVKSRQTRTSKGVQVKILNKELDLREFLQQKQMERILQLLTDQEYNLVAVAQDLKDEFNKALNDRFYELKTYFRKIHSFSAEKVKGDFVVIDQLKNLTKTAVSVAREVDKDIVAIITSMMISAGLEVRGKTIKLVLTIAENCNPLKALTDGAATDILDATSELANAVASFAKAARLVAAITILKNQATHIQNGFAKNEKFISNMKTIMESVSSEKKSEDFRKAKDAFLEAYSDFVPSISKPEVTEMASYFKNVVEQACELIEGTETMGAAIPKGIIGGTGLCWLTKIKIEKMISAYENIYDKQFELVAVLADYVKAQVALEAADGILADYDSLARNTKERESVLQRLQQVAGMSYVSYRIMVIQVIRLYCDELQYKAGGVRPHVCKDAGTDISTLLSYREPDCSSRNLEFQTAPSSRRSHKDMAYLDYRKLYSGEVVSFKIPNSRWLLAKGWITKADLHSVIYVSGFEVYLPSDVGYKRDIRVQVFTKGENELVPGGTRYRIMPERPMIFEYKLGYGVNCRQHRGYDNPYNTCPTNQIPDICPKTEYSCFLEVGSRNLFPSIFSHFRIRVNGYEGLPVPNPATPLPVKIGLRTCTYIPDRNNQQYIDMIKYQGKKRKPSTCCPEGQYWSGRVMACQNCPANTTVALKGYYCEKDTFE